MFSMFDSIAMFEAPWQWAIVLVIVLVLFGGSRIKDVMGSLGSGVKEFKKGLSEEEEDKTAALDSKDDSDKTIQTSKALGEQMVNDLNKIGYKASGQYLADSIQYPYVQNSKNHSKWNVAWSAWYQDYPAPSDFLNVLLGCGSIHPNSDASPNIAAFCDKSIQAQMNQAEAMGSNPTAANAIWQKVDHEMTDQAPWVDLYNPKQIDFLSKRVGNYQWNPQWYILIDQLWVK